MYPWKQQKIRQPKNGILSQINYSDIKGPLPPPPRGQEWVKDESTREWKLLSVATVTYDGDIVAEAHPTADDASNADLVCTAVPIRETEGTSTSNNNTSTVISGVRYHEVLPTDTFQGICLRYKVTPTELRQANRLMGNNLKLGPAKLVIPSNDKNKNEELDLDSQRSTKEEKIASLISKVTHITKGKITYSEAKSYLEIADWEVEEAVDAVKEDVAWSGEDGTGYYGMIGHKKNQAVQSKHSFHDNVAVMGIE